MRVYWNGFGCHAMSSAIASSDSSLRHLPATRSGGNGDSSGSISSIAWEPLHGNLLMGLAHQVHESGKVIVFVKYIATTIRSIEDTVDKSAL
jgi:hypothetical protein